MSSSSDEKKAIKKRLDKIEWEFMEATLKEQGEKEALDKLANHRRDNRKPFFLWKLQFLEVFQDKGGFDIMIANPPYVRQEEIKEFKPALKRSYTSYTGTADLYVYFYEKSLRLLNPSGVMVFISSNKYFRAGYGEKLRQLLTRTTRVDQIIDFGDAPVFEATNYPCIIILQDQPPNGNQPRVLNWQKGNRIEDFVKVFLEDSFTIPQESLSPDGWRLESAKVLHLLDKIREGGDPLAIHLNDRFFRGLVTGSNRAFVVDGKTRKRLIAEDKNSIEILKPFLRGRDIKKWLINYPDLWLCYIPWDLKIRNYPAVYAHIAKYSKELKSRPEVKEGRFPWYALSRYASEYCQEFLRPKIMYQEIATYQAFAYDMTGAFSNNKTYIIPSEDRSLLGILNSKLIWWFLNQVCSKLQGGALAMQTPYLSKVPVPRMSADQRRIFLKFVDYVSYLVSEADASAEDDITPRDQLMIPFFEKVIDAMIYELFFAEELHSAGKYFFEPLAQENLPDLGAIKSHRVPGLRHIFERLFDRENVIRQNIFFLDTLESVRIIEGKA